MYYFWIHIIPLLFVSFFHRRGRDTGFPVPPAQFPACSFPAPGSSAIPTSATGIARELKLSLPAVNFRDPRLLNPMAIH